jgi:hypothetical protein
MRESTQRYLRDLHKALLHLHKVLLEMERIAYEQVHGRVSAGELLKLVVGHDQFAWLHAVSESVVRIDELLDSDDTVEEGDVRSLLTQLRSLLVPAEGGTAFARNYDKALQRDPAAVLAHRAVTVIVTAAIKDLQRADR